jgi:hypothetical protein
VDARALRRALLRRLAALRAWATWTPRRAGTIVGVCLTVLVVSPLAVGITRNALAAPAPAPAESTTTGEQASAPPSVPGTDPEATAPVVTASPSGANDEDVPVTPAQEKAAAATSKQFATLWLAGAFVNDRKRWAATMKDLVDPTLMPYLEATPKSAVPRTTVTAVVPKLVAPDYGAVRVTFGDGTGMDLGVAATGTTWRVTQYLPVARR